MKAILKSSKKTTESEERKKQKTMFIKESQLSPEGDRHHTIRGALTLDLKLGISSFAAIVKGWDGAPLFFFFVWIIGKPF